MFDSFRQHKWPQLSADESRKRAKVLVIDDQEFVYLGLFKRDGYNIDKWDDVKDLQKLESGYYDLILLDIQGVAREISADQGLGLLRHLHNVAPAQIVIAYSNADWSLKYQDFFKLADAVLAKGKDYVEFKQTVDSLIAKRFSLEFYVDRISTLFTDDVSDKNKLRDITKRSILKHSDKKLSDFLHQETQNIEHIKLAIQIVNVAFQVMQVVSAMGGK